MRNLVDILRRRREPVDVMLAHAERTSPAVSVPEPPAYEDVSQASALAEPDERERFFGGRGLLRNALAARTGRLPRDLRIASGANGRLFLLDQDGGAPSFSIAHSDRWIVIGICDRLPIGVSVGAVGERPALASVVRTLVPPAAAAALNVGNPAQRAEAILRWWVSLDAAARACGATLDRARDCLRSAPPQVLEPVRGVLVGLAVRSSRPVEVRFTLLDRTGPAAVIPTAV